MPTNKINYTWVSQSCSHLLMELQDSFFAYVSFRQVDCLNNKTKRRVSRVFGTGQDVKCAQL